MTDSAEDVFEARHAGIVAGVAAIEARLATLPNVPLEVREDLVVVRQWIDQQSEPNNWKMTRMRDRVMADNLGALASRFDRMIVWAHNEHVERDYEFAMGAVLAARFGTAYLPIGMVFDGGSFLASETGVTLDDESLPVTVGPAPANDVAAAFARTGAPLLLADLRTAPDYFQRPQLTRETGWNSATEAEMEGPTRVAKRFAAVIYVAKSTPSHRL
jgi:erythromycin esterase-like protein